MTAQAATFPEWLTEPVESGAISPAQGFLMEWELTGRPGLPWTPEGWAAKQRAELHLWNPPENHPPQ